jgi:hypothetical protein
MVRETGDNMKYSELLSRPLEETGNTAYGIEVDDLILDRRPENLYRIGFVLNSLDVLDSDNYAMTVMLCLMTSGEYKREIIAEIPSTTEISDEMLLMLSGTKASVSLLPPRSDLDEDWRAYTERLKHFFEFWLRESNVNRLVYPIVGYFEYLVLEANGFVPKTIADDEYILKRFVDEFPIDRMDQVKDELMVFVHDYFGGREGFRKFIAAVGIAARGKAEIECGKLVEVLNKEMAQKAQIASEDSSGDVPLPNA